MQALANLLIICIVAYWMWRRWAASDSTAYWCGLGARLAGGIAIKLIYDFYYNIPGDTNVFALDALKLADLFHSDVTAYFNFLQTGEGTTLTLTEPRSAFFISLLSMIIIATNNYYVASMWLSLFSFLCSYRLVIELDKVFPSARVASRIALLFTPTVVFWTSGIIKESVAFGAVAMLVVYFLSLSRGGRLTWMNVISIIFFLALLLNLKYYWAAVLIPSIASGLIIHWTVEKRFDNMAIIVGLWLLVFLLLGVGASFTHPNFYFQNFLSVIVENHDTFVSFSGPDGFIEYYSLSPDWTSILINSPWALWSGLFRPMIFESLSATGYVAAFENLLLLMLVLWKLKYIRVSIPQNRTLVLTAIVYVVVLCVFLALSTPNFGTLSRYRVGFLPFFVLLILVDHPILKLIHGKSSDNTRR